VFVQKESGNHKGAVAEAKIAAAAIELGVPVLKPMSEHGRYDLVFDLAGRLLRVQCKWATRKEDVVVVHLGGSYLSPQGYVRSTYAAHEVDAIAAYCADLRECYLLPITSIAGQHMLHLLGTAEERPKGSATLGGRSHPLWGYSSAGRALPWHGRGRRFESG
jgi:hypothetical protein